MFKLFSFTFLFPFFIFLRLNLWTWNTVHFIYQYFRLTFGCRLLLSFHHLGFSKIRNFNGLSVVGGQSPSPCQISSKSVKRLRRYGDLTVFKTVAVRHLGFQTFNFLTVRTVKRPILHNLPKFRKDRSDYWGKIAIFVIFKMAAAAILVFEKFEILTVFPRRGQSASSRQISPKSVKRLRRYGDLTVFKMAVVRHLGLWKFKFFNGQDG